MTIQMAKLSRHYMWSLAAVQDCFLHSLINIEKPSMVRSINTHLAAAMKNARVPVSSGEITYFRSSVTSTSESQSVCVGAFYHISNTLLPFKRHKQPLEYSFPPTSHIVKHTVDGLMGH